MSLLALCTLLCMPDRFHLSRLADSAGLPQAVVLAIAYTETRNNLNPLVRGNHSEVGRYQIKPSTARERCPGLDIYTYRGNVSCALTMLAHDYKLYGAIGAIARHNGSGPASLEYAGRVLQLVGQWELEKPTRS